MSFSPEPNLSRASILKASLARAIEQQEGHLQAAISLVDRHRDLICRLAQDGLETSAEINFLYDLEKELETQKVRLGRLLYEGARLGAQGPREGLEDPVPSIGHLSG
jgi:hypothetical protein